MSRSNLQYVSHVLKGCMYNRTAHLLAKIVCVLLDFMGLALWVFFNESANQPQKQISKQMCEALAWMENNFSDGKTSMTQKLPIGHPSRKITRRLDRTNNKVKCTFLVQMLLLGQKRPIKYRFLSLQNRL